MCRQSRNMDVIPDGFIKIEDVSELESADTTGNNPLVTYK